MLRFIDAGESHGKCLLGIVEGFPEGMSLNLKLINITINILENIYIFLNMME